MRLVRRVESKVFGWSNWKVELLFAENGCTVADGGTGFYGRIKRLVLDMLGLSCLFGMQWR